VGGEMLIHLLFITVSILAVFSFTRFILLKKEIKKMGEQLQNYNKQSTNKKIDMTLLEKNIENLGVEINNLIDLHVKEKRKRIRFENELKQTIANMSHDLRTPLTSILGYIQMAEADEVPETERKEYISIAKKRAKRLETLLSDFFELSVIESNDYQLKCEKINIKDLAIDILMSFYDRFSKKDMEPTIHMPENNLYVYSDESAITRVIENLISNSLKHSDGNIMISLEEKDSRARLIVKNEAHSLTEKEVDHIFDRFYMADKSRSGKNTGLGLSIVKTLMDKMNGTITGRLHDGQLSIICEWELVKNESI
jgi:signal transduction histidine kinase